MSARTKKLLRDLWRLKFQALAIALLIAVGVAVTVMSYSSQAALKAARAAYYEETRFADVFATATRAPMSVARDLAEIEGVTVVDARVLEGGLMAVPGLLRPAVAKIISLPEREATALNRLALTAGRLPDPDRPTEAVALRTFLDAAHVKLGDELPVTANGRVLRLTVVGAALSPEYVFVASPDSFLPDDAHQAVLWMGRRAIERVADMDGAFNAVALKIAPGANPEAVAAAVNRRLASYGGRPALTRAEQPSNEFIDNEFRELSISGLIFPPIFLLVAAALVHMVLARLIDTEREHIGLLKAFGYTDAEAASPYLRLAGLIGLLGVVGGGLMGLWLAAAITDLYRDYMRFPSISARFDWLSYALASLAAVGAALAGALVSVRKAVGLTPAVAMAAPRPAAFRHGLLDRLAAWARLDTPSRMIPRNLERTPARTALTAIGLAASISLLVGTQFALDAFDEIIAHAYFQSQRASDTVAFADARGPAAIAEVARMPGVLTAEGVRRVPAIVAANGVAKRVGVLGVRQGSTLQRALDETGQAIPFKGEGLIVSQALASKLGVAAGDRVRLEITAGRRPTVALPVTAVATDYSGLAIYMERRALNRLMGEGDVSDAALLLADPDRREDFYAVLTRTPLAVGASSRDDTVRNFREVILEGFSTTLVFYLTFAGAIAFGVAYNASRIALSERARDLATLEVLGFTHAETAYILLGELALIAAIAIPLGFMGGWALALGIGEAFSRDDLRLPTEISARSYGMALATFLAALGLSAFFVARRVWRLDLVAVLKTRE